MSPTPGTRSTLPAGSLQSQDRFATAMSQFTSSPTPQQRDPSPQQFTSSPAPSPAPQQRDPSQASQQASQRTLSPTQRAQADFNKMKARSSAEPNISVCNYASRSNLQ